MSIPGIEGFTPFVPPTVASPEAGAVGGVDESAAAGKSSGVDFASLLSDGIERMEGLQDKASELSVQAATGNLSNLHDYTIAATEASTATQLTTAVRNKALEAFNDIMRMQI